MPKLKDDEDLPQGMYRLNPKCPVHVSHVQKLNSRDHVACVSGKLPRPPKGDCPEKGVKRIKWIREADAWALHIGTLLSPWDRNGFCGVTTWDGLQDLRDKWKNVNAKAENVWSKYVSKPAGNMDGGDGSEYPEEVFPEPTGRFRLNVADNLACNMQLPEKQKLLVNAWRYECADKFSKEEQTKAQLYAGGSKGHNSPENALAIASLIDSMKKGTAAAGGIKADTQIHLDRLLAQLKNLGERTCQSSCLVGPRLPVEFPCWDGSYDQSWAKKTLADLANASPTTQDCDRTGSDQCDGSDARALCSEDFDHLRYGQADHADKDKQYALAADQIAAFDVEVEKCCPRTKLCYLYTDHQARGKHKYRTPS